MNSYSIPTIFFKFDALPSNHYAIYLRTIIDQRCTVDRTVNFEVDGKAMTPRYLTSGNYFI
jgi:hypothetical protein